jgi:uncharacterized membrane protein
MAMSSDGRFVVANENQGEHDDYLVRWTADGAPLALEIKGYPSGVSDNGLVIVGSAQRPLTQFFWVDDAFRWTATDGIQNIAPGYFQSWAGAVSNDGNTVTGSVDHNDTGTQFSSRQEAFRWTSTGGLQLLGTLPGDLKSSAGDISPDGNALIGSSSRFDNSGRLLTRAFRWTQQTGMVELGPLPPGIRDVSAHSGTPNMSVVVGQLGSYPDVTQPGRWTQSTGWVVVPDLVGGDIDLNGPAYASAVSADGAIIVGRGVDPSGPEPFIWDAIHGTRNLTTVLRDEFGLSDALIGWNLTQAADISDDGRTICGWGRNPANEWEYWVAYLGSVATPFGDFNNDGTADAADYILWRKNGVSGTDYTTWRANFGQNQTTASGDLNGDGAADAADYVIWRKSIGTPAAFNAWRAHFGQPVTSGSGTAASATVPEPSSLALIVSALLVIRTGRNRVIRRRAPLFHL